MESAFIACSGLVISAIDAPDLTDVRNMEKMFSGATSLSNQSLNHWDVSEVTSMREMFTNCTNFNGDISNWDVSKVRDMIFMLLNCSAFNQDLSNWDLSEADEISSMLINSGMSTENYDNTLIGWATLDADETRIPTDVNFSISTSFCESIIERQHLKSNYGWTIGDTGLADGCEVNYFETTWNTVDGESITIPTTGTGYNFMVNWGDGNQNITVHNDTTDPATLTHQYGSTNAARIVKIYGDFPRIYFNDTGDKDKIMSIEQWGDIEWKSMSKAFEGCENLKITNPNIDTPNLSTVADMDLSSMFRNCSDFNGDVTMWDVSNVTNMSGMFDGAAEFDQPLNNWNVSRVDNMAGMFYNATSFDQNIGVWDISSLSQANSMFGDINNENVPLSVENYDALLIGWSTLDTDSGETQIPEGVPFDAGESRYCAGESAKGQLEDLNWTIEDGGKGSINTCDPVPFITEWLIPAGGGSITIPTTGGGYDYDVDWNYDGSTFNADSTGQTGDTTHNYGTGGTYTVAIRGTFPRISFLNSIDGSRYRIIDVKQWGTIEWDTMESAFIACTSLGISAIDAPDLTRVTNMEKMFNGATSLNQSLNHWNVSEVTNMQQMFTSCTNFNGDVSNWDVSKVEQMTVMFFNCSAFNQDLSNWDLSKVDTAMNNMLSNSGMTKENYDNTLKGWATLDANETRIPTNVTLGAHGLYYCNAVTERQSLINTYEWTITGDDFNCDIVLYPKVYLQGAYNSADGYMRDDLRVAGLITTDTPYTDGKTILQSVLDVSGLDAIVDWVWVELRDKNDNTNVIDSQSALLQRDGDIVDVDGVSPLSFNQASDAYYVVISHRNHLGIITANTVSLSGSLTTLDLFSDSTLIDGGTNAVIEIGEGIFALYAGDFDGNGQVQNTDLTGIRPLLGQPASYNNADLDMNGQVQNTDINNLLNPNTGKGQQFARIIDLKLFAKRKQ